jgi:hypothetical protein
VEAITAETASKHIKMLADSAILMPFSITASIELEDAIATLEGLQLKDEDVIKEAKDHIIIKPVLQTDSYPLLGPAFSEISETAFLDNPIWLHHIWLGSDVGGMFISGTEGISHRHCSTCTCRRSTLEGAGDEGVRVGAVTGEAHAR